MAVKSCREPLEKLDTQQSEKLDGEKLDAHQSGERRIGEKLDTHQSGETRIGTSTK